MAHTTTSSTPAAAPRLPRYERVYVWQLPVRIFHWVNAGALVVLFATGLAITHPPFQSPGAAPDVQVMGLFRQVHFAAAYVFTAVFLWRISWFFLGNKYARSGIPYVWRPSWWRNLWRQSTDYLRLDFGHRHLGHNALAGLSYTLGVIGLGWAQIFTGFALYSESNPEGVLGRLFGWVIPLCGGSFRTHMWHHLFAWGFVVFTILHVYIVLLDARQYRNGLLSSMITGYKFRRAQEEER